MSSGTNATLNVPFVTAKAVGAPPVPAVHVPEPEKVPWALVELTDVRVTVPLVKTQANDMVVRFDCNPYEMMTSVQETEEQEGSIGLLPTVVRLMVTVATSHVVLVFGTAAVA